MGGEGWGLEIILGLLGTFVTVRKSGIGLHTVKNLRLLVLSETETVTHAYIAGTAFVTGVWVNDMISQPRSQGSFVPVPTEREI